MTGLSLDLLEKHVWPNGERRDVWMIVDAARDERIFPMLLNCHLDNACLYTGAPSELDRVAPYLVRLDYGYRDTHAFLEQGLGNQWGVVLRCDVRLERLRTHLRRLLTVRDPSGKRLLFRYYDPRVLRVYLPTCVETELREIFGPIEAFWCEDESPANLIEFRMAGSRLVQNKRAIIP